MNNRPSYTTKKTTSNAELHQKKIMLSAWWDWKSSAEQIERIGQRKTAKIGQS